MSEMNTVVAFFDSHDKAEKTIRQLQKDGFDMKKLSIIGRDYHTEEHAIGYYNSGDRMLYWGKQGAFWGGVWGLLFGAAFFWVPGVGPLLIAGPLITCIVAALESAVVVGGMSVLGGALASIGIPENSIIQFESEVKNGKYLLTLQGTPEEMTRAKTLLSTSGALKTHSYQAKLPTAVLV
jgi:uncharacterized membrane protein